MWFARFLTPCLCLSLVAACDDTPVQANPDAIDCGDDVDLVEVEVTNQQIVAFDWSPRCRVALLLVEEGASDRWSVGNGEVNSIEPPVIYGVVPDGEIGTTAEPLVAGTEYEVILWLVDDPGNARMVANQPFTR